MLGYALRAPENRPISLALKFSIEKMKTMKSRKGRPTTNLFDTIKKDIEQTGHKLETLDDFQKMREMANNRKHWEEIIINSVRHLQ